MSIKFKTTLTVFALILSATFASTNTWAAADGDLDLTSTGNFDVDIIIPGRVRISGLSEFDFGLFLPGIGTLSTLDQDICVYSNHFFSRYGVTASGDGAANAFTVSSGINTIPYDVYWNDTTGTTGASKLITTQKSPNQENANSQSKDCSTGGLSANVSVEFSPVAVGAIPSGDYTGELTILIEPN